MPRAVFNGQVIAESDGTTVVDGRHYFAPDAVQPDFLVDSALHTTCHWKGTASYYDVVVGDQIAVGAAWYYPNASGGAKHIENHIAFWKGVTVEV